MKAMADPRWNNPVVVEGGLWYYTECNIHEHLIWKDARTDRKWSFANMREVLESEVPRQTFVEYVYYLRRNGSRWWVEPALDFGVAAGIINSDDRQKIMDAFQVADLMLA